MERPNAAVLDDVEPRAEGRVLVRFERGNADEPRELGRQEEAGQKE